MKSTKPCSPWATAAAGGTFFRLKFSAALASSSVLFPEIRFTTITRTGECIVILTFLPFGYTCSWLQLRAYIRAFKRIFNISLKYKKDYLTDCDNIGSGYSK